MTFKKVTILFDTWKITQFLDENTSLEKLERMFPKSSGFVVDENFRQLNHGR